MRFSGSKFTLIWCALGACLSACGAPTKSASDVAGIFSSDAVALPGLMLEICQNLRVRPDAPNMDGASLSDTECSDAGHGADNYKTVTDKFKFAGLESQISSQSGNDVLHIKTRSKVWLNSGILDLALKLSNALKNRDTGGADPFVNPSPAGGGGDKLANLLKTKVREVEKFSFDQAKKSFAGTINIHGSGLVTIDNDIAITGKIFENAIALNLRSPSQVRFETSLLRNVNAIGIIVPYADDVYVDLTFEIDIHAIGLKNTLTSKIESALGSAMKSGLDSLLKLAP
jgi:hypothetical protein